LRVGRGYDVVYSDNGRARRVDRFGKAEIPMSGSTKSARRVALKALVELDLSVSEALQHLASFPWESEYPLVRVRDFDVARVLRRYLEGDLSPDDCEDWANAIESREDLSFDRETLLKNVIFELANPFLTRPLTPGVAADLLDQVSPES
jgi:hypothetical protein